MALAERKLAQPKKSISSKDIENYRNAAGEIKKLEGEIADLGKKKTAAQKELKEKEELLTIERKLRAKERASELSAQSAEKLKEVLGNLSTPTDDLTPDKIQKLISKIETDIKANNTAVEELKKLQQVRANYEFYLHERKAEHALQRNDIIKANTDQQAVEFAKQTQARVNELHQEFKNGEPVTIKGRSLHHFANTLHVLYSNERELQRRKEDLSSKLATLKLQHENREQSRLDASKLKKQAETELKDADVYKDEPIASVKKSLEAFTPENKDAINKRIDALKKEIETTSTELTKKQRELNDKKTFVETASPALKALADDPEKFYFNLLTLSKKAFAEYKRSYPRNADAKRDKRQGFHLDMFERYVYAIEMLEAKTQQEALESKRLSQTKSNVISYQDHCFILCGLLTFVDWEPLSGSVKTILDQAEINQKEAFFTHSKHSNQPSSFLVATVSIPIPQLRYQSRRTKLISILDEFKPFIGNKAVQDFYNLSRDLLLLSSARKDYEFPSDIFRTVIKLIDGKANNNAEKIKKYSERLQRLAKTISHEQPSTAKTVTGIIGMFLSALAVILGAIAKYVALSFLSSISPPLMVACGVGFIAAFILYRHGSQYTGYSARIVETGKAINKIPFNEKTFGSKASTVGFWRNLSKKIHGPVIVPIDVRNPLARGNKT